MIKIAWVVCPLWFIANFAYNYSLLLTSVGSSTIIRLQSPAVPLFFSRLTGFVFFSAIYLAPSHSFSRLWPVLKPSLTGRSPALLSRWVGLLWFVPHHTLCFSCAGPYFIYLSQIGVQDHDNGNTRTLEGDAVALLASAAYGLYTTAIKIKVLNVYDMPCDSRDIRSCRCGRFPRTTVCRCSSSLVMSDSSRRCPSVQFFFYW